ncbi:trafficking protein particle complex subunit 13 [Citrus sinensis]|uniref:Trafficking protein particle complex subunit 13 n=1 Tax=Citrus sinensis TaxID=2711 RepID=A0ACB8NGA4_CITSI|nr:trafficking protein particle complex subunit 13 [Citrus sinensis]KAH9796912.1 trafficking protein particle complex subunit 13 [Citrus sinensis]
MSSTPGTHSLAFRVMRLCRPSLHVEPPLRVDPTDLFIGEDIFDDPIAASNLPPLISSDVTTNKSSDLTYRSRFLLHDSADSIGLSGLLVLPQAFGAIYLGETFCSYISINNSSTLEVRDVVIKAEIQTDKQRILLLDTSKSPVESIRAGGRYDFIVEHDVKELGAHTLVCTALYSDGEGERKYLPQFFKFIVSNPLSVRTKVRVVKEITFLEACIENHTKSNLYMDQVEFEPSQNWSATMLKADGPHSDYNAQSREIFKPPVLIRSGGGIHNYLYQLKMLSHGSSSPVKVQGSNVLGKLQITWRTNLGEPGRLQTQQILGTTITSKEIELNVVEVPSVVGIDKPFLALAPVEAFGSTDFHLNLIATKLGVQRITGITVFDKLEKITYDSLPDLEVGDLWFLALFIRD